MDFSTDSTAFDYHGSLKRMGNDRQLFEEMAVLLHEDAPPLLERLCDALGEEDFESVRHAAHSLKGQATNFGASRTVQAAARVEFAARDRHIAELPAAVRELDAALHELLSELGMSRAATGGQH